MLTLRALEALAFTDRNSADAKRWVARAKNLVGNFEHAARVSPFTSSDESDTESELEWM